MILNVSLSYCFNILTLALQAPLCYIHTMTISWYQSSFTGKRYC